VIYIVLCRAKPVGVEKRTKLSKKNGEKSLQDLFREHLALVPEGDKGFAEFLHFFLPTKYVMACVQKNGLLTRH
jgi:hypothetical protein